ncbi:MAG: hypothetical protein JWP04_3236 [Belnapia sp.]|nr:hypothetical protein [Belnapia sp.]
MLVAKAHGLDPKALRKALRQSKTINHARYEKWTFPVGSAEHKAMESEAHKLQARRKQAPMDRVPGDRVPGDRVPGREG